MKLACIYINALHFRDTVSFYEQLLQQKGKEVTAQRWVEFSCGHTLAVLHAEYDAQCVQKNRMWTNTIIMHMSKTAYRR